MHRYEVLVLKALEAKKTSDLNSLMEKTGLGRDEVLWSIENLSRLGAVEVKRETKQEARLTEEGVRYATSHMPEFSLIQRADKEPIEMQQISDNESRIGLQWAKTKQLIEVNKGLVTITQKGKEALRSGVQEERVLKLLREEPASYPKLEEKFRNEMNNLLKRKLIEVSKKSEIDRVSITQAGLEYAAQAKTDNEIDALSRKIIVNKEWAGRKFKSYDVNVKVERACAAKMHPLRQVINKFRRIYLSMGFKETSGPIVVPAFWTFDSLFMPQDHPARDVQDTFYLSNPKEIEIGNRELVGKVKVAHEASWHSDWLEKVAMQAVLRTQMTSVSVRELYNLSRYKDYKLPLKLFSIGRLFRNENIDYKHLAELYQTDGIIIGKDLTFANLFDTLIKIYRSLGLKVRFKPTYFPFVEPGAEVQGFDESKGEWLELGGAGVLRREITGIARKDVTVLAWGLGVERVLLIKGETERLSELYNRGIGWMRNHRLV